MPFPKKEKLSREIAKHYFILIRFNRNIVDGLEKFNGKNGF